MQKKEKKYLFEKYSIIFFIILLILIIISVFISIKYPGLIPIRLTSPGYPEVELPTTIGAVTTGPCIGVISQCEYYHDSFTCGEICGCEWTRWMTCAIPSGGRTKSCADLQNPNDCATCGCTWTGESSSSLINDENYVRTQMNAFLKNNPNANENYARDVVYRNIASIEKNPEICLKINDEYLKKSCYNAVV